MRAAVALFIYEANTFHPETASFADAFEESGVWKTGREETAGWAKTAGNEMTGSLEMLEELGWESFPLFAAFHSAPGGRLSGEAFEKLWETLSFEISKVSPIDWVILHLHGASAAVGIDSPEHELIRRLRSLPGFGGKIAVSLDLHANLTAGLVNAVDTLTAYRTFPHIDQKETGRRIAFLASNHKENLKPVFRKLDFLLPPTTVNDGNSEFRNLQQLARQHESETQGLDVSLFPVQPWLDVAELGSSVLVCGPEQRANKVASEIADAWRAGAAAFRETGLIELCASTREHLIHSEYNGNPWILVDTGDAITGGAPGTSAAVLEWLLPHSADFPGEVLLQVVDPEAVATAKPSQQSFILGSQRVRFHGEVERKVAGRFLPRAESYGNIQMNAGELLVLRKDRLQVVVAERPTFGNCFPGFFECASLLPEQAFAVQVKSFSGWMSGYPASVNRGIVLGSPGATSLEFSSLPFSRTTRERLGLVPPIKDSLRA